MTINIILGFIIPWIFGIWLFNRDKKIVLIIMPFTSIVAHTVNSFGFTLKFWMLKPFELHTFSALPFDLGLFALLGCAFIYIVKNKKVNPYILIFIFALLITIMEYIGVSLGYVKYGNGWNIIYTYFSYLIPFAIVYWYYLGLKKLNVF